MRVAFSLFVSLFFMTPVCTIFVPFCTVTWMVAIVVMALPVFYLSGKWGAAITADPGPAETSPR